MELFLFLLRNHLIRKYCRPIKWRCLEKPSEKVECHLKKLVLILLLDLIQLLTNGCCPCNSLGKRFCYPCRDFYWTLSSSFIFLGCLVPTKSFILIPSRWMERIILKLISPGRWRRNNGFMYNYIPVWRMLRKTTNIRKGRYIVSHSYTTTYHVYAPLVNVNLRSNYNCRHYPLLPLTAKLFLLMLPLSAVFRCLIPRPNRKVQGEVMIKFTATVTSCKCR